MTPKPTKPDQDGFLHVPFRQDQWSAFARMLGVDPKSLASPDKILDALAERLGVERRAVPIKASRPAMPTLAEVEAEHSLLTAEQRARQSSSILVANAQKRALEHENAKLRREAARR